MLEDWIAVMARILMGFTNKKIDWGFVWGKTVAAVRGCNINRVVCNYMLKVGTGSHGNGVDVI